MNTNKTVKIGWTTYRMHQNAQTGWVFVKGTHSRTKNNSFSVAKIIDGQVVEMDSPDALAEVTNEELVEGWLNS